VAWKKRNNKLRDLAEGLLKAGALQFGTFTLADGRDSPYYVNLRGVPSYPGVYRLVVDALADLASKKAAKSDALCAVPTSGLMIAAPVAVALSKPLVYIKVNKQPNDRAVEGEVRPGWNVTILDDLATSGKTILSTAEIIEDEGGHVGSALVLIDRLEGAREKLSKKGITLHSVTDMLELADVLHSMELISADNLKAITRSVGAVSRPSGSSLPK
jgi:orotate phosphoribosyltransferase